MKKITLSIPEPCHEDWNKMTPLQQGRFCGSCQKEVIDFTAMTDDELFRFFAEKKSGRVCGRTLPVQLNTPIAKPAEHKKRKLWYISYLTSLLLFFSKSETKAQAKTPVSVSPTTKPTVVGRMIRLPVETGQPADFVTGKVTDENGHPVPYASVVISETKRGTHTDELGNYKLKAKAGDILTLSAVGFVSENFTIVQPVSNNVILTRLKQDLQGQIVVVAGGISISRSDDYVAPDQPRHIAQLYVKDKENNTPLANAKLGIVRNNQYRQKKRYTSSQGFYELRNIKESDTYTITVSAIGYKEQSVTINGDEFRKRKMDWVILLEKPEPPKEITAQNDVNMKNAFKGTNCCYNVTFTCIQNTLSLKQNPFSQFLNTSTSKIAPLDEVKPVKPAFRLSVYPNPVIKGGSVSLTAAGFTPGNYTLSIVNTAGEQVYSMPVNITENRISPAVNTAHVKNPGIYVIEILSESGNKAACKLLVM